MDERAAAAAVERSVGRPDGGSVLSPRAEVARQVAVDIKKKELVAFIYIYIYVYIYMAAVERSVERPDRGSVFSPRAEVARQVAAKRWVKD